MVIGLGAGFGTVTEECRTYANSSVFGTHASWSDCLRVGILPLSEGASAEITEDADVTW